ncbi:hypothetical protein ACJX0J_016863 [Zea mays]
MSQIGNFLHGSELDENAWAKPITYNHKNRLSDIKHNLLCRENILVDTTFSMLSELIFLQFSTGLNKNESLIPIQHFLAFALSFNPKKNKGLVVFTLIASFQFLWTD